MFPRGTWAFPQGKFIVCWGTIMSLRRRSLSCPNEQLKPFFLENNHVLKEKEFFLPLEHGCYLGQLKFCLFWEHGCSQGSNLNPFYFTTLFSSILFMDEKYNSKKRFEPMTLGYKGDSNHCISFFP